MRAALVVAVIALGGCVQDPPVSTEREQVTAVDNGRIEEVDTHSFAAVVLEETDNYQEARIDQTCIQDPRGGGWYLWVVRTRGNTTPVGLFVSPVTGC